MWSTFVPLVPNSILPGTTAFVIAVAAVFMVSFQLLPLYFPLIDCVHSLQVHSSLLDIIFEAYLQRSHILFIFLLNFRT